MGGDCKLKTLGKSDTTRLHDEGALRRERRLSLSCGGVRYQRLVFYTHCVPSFSVHWNDTSRDTGNTSGKLWSFSGVLLEFL